MSYSTAYRREDEQTSETRTGSSPYGGKGVGKSNSEEPKCKGKGKSEEPKGKGKGKFEEPKGKGKGKGSKGGAGGGSDSYGNTGKCGAGGGEEEEEEEEEEEAAELEITLRPNSKWIHVLTEVKSAQAKCEAVLEILDKLETEIMEM